MCCNVGILVSVRLSCFWQGIRIYEFWNMEATDWNQTFGLFSLQLLLLEFFSFEIHESYVFEEVLVLIHNKL